MKKSVILAVSLILCFSSFAQEKKPAIKNKYILQLNPVTGDVEKTDAVDTLIWLKNGFGVIRVIYKEGGFDNKLAKTEVLDDDFTYPVIKGGKAAWGIIDPSGKFILEPRYYSIDLWSNFKGIAYRWQKTQNGTGYYFSTYVNLNNRKVKYLGDAIDFASMDGPDFILIQTMRSEGAYNGRDGLYDSDLNTLIDTVVGDIGLVRGTHMTGIHGLQVRPTLANINNTVNPKYITHYDRAKDELVVYDNKLNVIVKPGIYDNISPCGKYLLAKKPKNSGYSLLDSSMNQITANFYRIYFENGYYIFDMNGGKFSFTNEDLKPVNDSTYKDLYSIYYSKYQDEKKKLDEFREKMGPFYLGKYNNFELTVGNETYRSSGEKFDDYFTINEFKDNEVMLRFNEVTYRTNVAADIYKHTWSGSMSFLVKEGTIPVLGEPDAPGYIFYNITIISSSSGLADIAGYLNTNTSELYLTGTTDGKNFTIKAKKQLY